MGVCKKTGGYCPFDSNPTVGRWGGQIPDEKDLPSKEVAERVADLVQVIFDEGGCEDGPTFTDYSKQGFIIVRCGNSNLLDTSSSVPSTARAICDLVGIDPLVGYHERIVDAELYKEEVGIRGYITF